jgi:hypothetical protein
MRKAILILASVVLFLSACRPAGPAPLPTPTSGPPMAGCQVAGLVPDLNPTMTAAIPPIGPDDHLLGNPQAKITLLEYGDFQ